MKFFDLTCFGLRNGGLAVAGILLALISIPHVSSTEIGATPAANLGVDSNHDYTINIRITPWLVQPIGEGALGSLGTDVDLHDDLGLDDYRVQPAGTINLRFGRHDIWFDGLGLDFAASDRLERTITFGSLTIPVSRAIRSEVDLQLYDLRYGYSFFDREEDGFRFGPTIGVSYLDLDLRITDLGAATTERLSESFPVPRLGLQGSVPIGDFELGAKVSGLYVAYKNFDGYTIEGDVSVAWRPLRNLGLVAGYRAIRTDVNVDVDNFNLTFHGPYLGAEIRF